MEQRLTDRIDTRIPTRLVTSDGQTVSAVIRDISMGGLFLETAEPLYPDTCVDVCVRMPGRRGTHTVPAVVTNVRGHGVGMRFSAIDYELCNALSNFTPANGQDSRGPERRVASR